MRLPGQGFNGNLAVGGMNPQPIQKEQIATDVNKAILQMNQNIMQMNQAIQTLVARLAPNQINQSIDMKNLAPGASKTMALTQGFNSIVCSIDAGTIEIYFGNQQGNIPDYVFTGNGNIQFVPFPLRNDRTVTVVVNAGSASAVTGKVYFQSY